MRSHDHPVRGHDTNWKFSTCDDALEQGYPSTRQRVAAATCGVACAIALYSWAVPPQKSLKAGSAEHAAYTRIVPDALRALTGLASSARSGSAQRASTAPGAGIRN